MTDAVSILTCPGRLYRNPTGLTDAADFGTDLGYTTDGLRIIVTPHTAPITGEEFGSEEIDRLIVGTTAQVLLTLRQWDADTLSAALPGLSAVGATSGGRHMRLPGAAADLWAGRSLGAYSATFLWVPDDISYNPIVLIHDGRMRLQDGAALRVGDKQELAVPVVIDVARADDLIDAVDDGYPYRALYVGPIEDAEVYT